VVAYDPATHMARAVAVTAIDHGAQLPLAAETEEYWSERSFEDLARGGRKRCPGRRLALLELEVVLEAALAGVSVHPAAAELERPRWRSVIVAPHAGSRVVLRNGSTARPRGRIGSVAPRKSSPDI
jgi:hypothetical protein